MIIQTGENLTFLVSLPRSGSTLLQKMLAGHSKIHSIGEPWLLLPLLYSNQKDFINIPPHEPYNSLWARNSINKAFSHLPDKEKFLNEVGVSIYLSYVNQIMAKQNDKVIFLDKTPRYYFIVDEIQNVFPKAKIILLYRDPLDVLYSILKTWVKRKYPLLAEFKYDLTEGLDKLIDKRINCDKEIYYLKYEDLVSNSETEIKNICDYFGIEFSSEMLNYSRIKGIKYDRGDKNNLEKKSISGKSVSRWFQDDNLSYQEWRLLYDYLEQIGRKKYNELGYSFEKKKKLLMDKRDKLSKGLSLPLKFYFNQCLKPLAYSLKVVSTKFGKKS